MALPARAEVPRGAFSLSPAGVACRDTVLSNPSVDGVSIRQDWKDLEPTEGVYNWTFLDAEVARVSAAGKMIILRINTQFSKPAWVTQAVVAAGGQFFTFNKDGVTTTIPVFWDPTFLSKKKAMIVALGAHFTGESAIKIVWASFANASSEDWSVPHAESDVNNWFAAGYTTQKMLDAGKQIIDTTMTAFPNQLVTLAVGGNGHRGATGNLDPDESYVARNAVLAARGTWPGRLIVQKNSLATYNAPAPGSGTVYQLLWDSRPDVGAQMLDSTYDDNTYRNNAGVTDDPATILHKSINTGAGYEVKFIEIYQLDVLNLPAEITYAHQVLLGLAEPTGTPPPLPAAPRAPTGLTAHEE
ncbi:MAG: beta-galactosidase [Chthoniobacterales bacterium]